MRRLAHLGASRGPTWWVRYSPPFFGWAAAVAVPSARRSIAHNLRRVRGPVSPLREAQQVLSTFGSYASCLAEVLANDGPKGLRTPEVVVHGERYLQQALAKGRGLILVTAHTGGWESVGPLLGRTYGLPLVLVMQPEPDAEARRIHDDARRAAGVEIMHVADPLSALPLLRHLRRGGVAALQLDRVAPGMRTRDVTLFGRPGQIPEGPLLLARLTGAPILPVFCARIGFRRYLAETFAPRFLPRDASEEVLTEAATHLAEAMTTFLREHPTQWFHFEGKG